MLLGTVEWYQGNSCDVLDYHVNFIFKVGHDGTAPGSGWFVKEIEIDMPTKGKHYTFACKQWLARDKSDGKTSRTFSVEDGISSVSSYKPSKYTV